MLPLTYPASFTADPATGSELEAIVSPVDGAGIRGDRAELEANGFSNAQIGLVLSESRPEPRQKHQQWLQSALAVDGLGRAAGIVQVRMVPGLNTTLLRHGFRWCNPRWGWQRR